MLPSTFSGVVCLRCAHRMPPDPMLTKCEQCGGLWLDADYDYAKVNWPDALRRRPASMWRYAELLPLSDPSRRVTLGEGFTPLIRAEGLSHEWKHSNIFIKDERQSPTSSFKDRQGALSVSLLHAMGITECVLASTGNAAAAYAAYCARAGIKLWIFLTSMAPAEKMRELGLYGAEVVKVTGTYDDAKQIAADFAQRRGIYFDRGAKAVVGKESMKTIAYEIAEQLGLERETSDGRWIAPDWYVQAVSGGIGPLGVIKGFGELYRMGLVDHIPKLAIIQVEGCSPMVQAFRAGKAVAEPVIPHTRITVLSTGDPGQSYTMLYEAIREHGGTMTAVDDGEAFRIMRKVARIEGFSVEPASAVAFAGLEQLINARQIHPDETVILNCSGHTFPAEKHILEDQYILDLELGGTAHEGLSAALERLDEQIKTVVVIDDNPNDSRLIRKLLQAYKNYRVFESNNPVEGFELVKQRQPGLVITDLTMPGIDGFALLDKLKTDPDTAHIPVVVVSAKSITSTDERRLAGRQESLWQKGNFNTRELVEHVVSTLNDTVPVRTAPATTPHPTPAKPAEKLEQPASDSRKRVLVVDDNPPDSRLIRRILEAERRYTVIEAASGAAALKILQENPPDLIMLDLMMPDMTGFELVHQMQAEPALATLPVIVVTAKDVTATERAQLGDVTLWHKANLDRRRLLQSVESIFVK